ncbi:F-box domain containing protein [Tanacetum coccineum]|uniref:F-box domain containing protein n=1 Tax=Tanacetum coccineum TaxID=301880 RepID=A0ABQ4YJI2_9ASTR
MRVYVQRQASDTQEYPSLIDTFWRTHTVDGVFPKDEDRRIYEEMKRLEATGEYTEDEINALARGGKLRGHIPGVGRVLPSRATSRPSMPAPDKSLKSMHRKVDFMMSLFRSDSKYSDMFKEFESGGASGSGGCGDDEESGDDEDDDGESCDEYIQVLIQGYPDWWREKASKDKRPSCPAVVVEEEMSLLPVLRTFISTILEILPKQRRCEWRRKWTQGQPSRLSKELQCAVTFFPEFCIMQDLYSRTLIGAGDCEDGLYKMGMFENNRHAMMTTQIQFEKNIKRIRCDNGGEFVSNKMIDFYAREGIVLETSCPHTPQQNGVVERKHRHLLETARALKFEANLPTRFWGECVLTAAHVINRLPSEVIENKTPMKSYTNSKIPNYDHHGFSGLGFAYYRSVETKGDKFEVRRSGVSVGIHRNQWIQRYTISNIEKW